MTSYSMFVWSSKKLKRVECSIVQALPVEQDISLAKYTRRLVSSEHGVTIYVIGTGDVLSTGTLAQLARQFVAGNFVLRKGKWRYDISPR